MAQGNITYSKIFQSSHIHGASYDPVDHRLEVTFTNGRRYTNDPDIPVPGDVWLAFAQSGSPGEFFDKEIKSFWNGQEMRHGQPATTQFDPALPVAAKSIP